MEDPPRRHGRDAARQGPGEPARHCRPTAATSLYRVFSGKYPAVLRVVRLEDGQAEPFEIAVDARRRTTVTLGRARWMPDGKAIAFVGQDEAGASGVYVQDFAPGRDTAATRRKLAGFDPDVAAESFGVAPDGSRLVVAGWVQLFSLMEGEGLPGPPRPAAARRAARRAGPRRSIIPRLRPEPTCGLRAQPQGRACRFTTSCSPSWSCGS